MRAVESTPAELARRIRRTKIRQTEQLFGEPRNELADIAKVLWPDKAAAELASLAGCTVRAVELSFGGYRKWSGKCVAAINMEINRRHLQRAAN